MIGGILEKAGWERVGRERGEEERERGKGRRKMRGIKTEEEVKENLGAL